MSKNMTDKYDVVIGLEIHIQTKTKTKMFCSCVTGYFHEEPNTHVCPVCLGLPGALPTVNKHALELCILMGLAVHCEVDSEVHFDRSVQNDLKNSFIHKFYMKDISKRYELNFSLIRYMLSFKSVSPMNSSQYINFLERNAD